MGSILFIIILKSYLLDGFFQGGKGILLFIFGDRDLWFPIRLNTFVKTEEKLRTYRLIYGSTVEQNCKRHEPWSQSLILCGESVLSAKFIPLRACLSLVWEINVLLLGNWKVKKWYANLLISWRSFFQ